MALGERGKAIGDPGNLKISEVAPNIGDVIEGIFLHMQQKQQLDEMGFPKPDSQPYWIYHIFTPNQGELKLTSGGSNLGKQIDAAIQKKQLDPDTLPAICIETVSCSDYVDSRSGEKREWWNVKLYPLTENDVIAKLRFRARQEMEPIEYQEPPKQRPTGPGNYYNNTRALPSGQQQQQQQQQQRVAAAPPPKPAASFDDAMNDAMHDEIPF